MRRAEAAYPGGRALGNVLFWGSRGRRARGRFILVGHEPGYGAAGDTPGIPWGLTEISGREIHERVPLPGLDDVLIGQARGAVAKVPAVHVHDPRRRTRLAGWYPDPDGGAAIRW